MFSLLCLVVVGLMPAVAQARSHRRLPRRVAREASAIEATGTSASRAVADAEVQAVVGATNAPEKIEAALGSDFAGIWFDNANSHLVVGLASDTSRAIAEQAAAAAGVSAYVEEKSVRSSWTELLAAQEAWNAKLSTLIKGQEASTSLVPASNAVSVALSSAVPSSTIATLEDEASTASVNTLVNIVAPSGLEATPDSTTSCYHPYCNKPIAPGVEIYSEPEGGTLASCTSGPLAVGPNGYTYMITAGHCAEAKYITETGYWSSCYANGYSCGAIGKVAVGSTHLNEWGDFTAVLINSAFWTNAGEEPLFGDTAEWKTNTSYNVVGEESSYQGLANCHAGWHSGEQCGTVLAVNVTVTISYSPHGKSEPIAVHGLVEDSACTDAGDSGGPWFSTGSPGVDGSALMEGITLASVGECFAEPSWYEPLQTILSTEGLVLLTAYNQKR
jgi:hypothetical protein